MAEEKVIVTVVSTYHSPAVQLLKEFGKYNRNQPSEGHDWTLWLWEEELRIKVYRRSYKDDGSLIYTCKATESEYEKLKSLGWLEQNYQFPARR